MDLLSGVALLAFVVGKAFISSRINGEEFNEEAVRKSAAGTAEVLNKQTERILENKRKSVKVKVRNMSNEQLQHAEYRGSNRAVQEMYDEAIEKEKRRREL